MRTFRAEFKRASGTSAKKRGYDKQRGLFSGFPHDVRWSECRLTTKQLKRVSLIRNEPNWLALGGFLREPVVAARWLTDHSYLVDSTRRYHRQMLEGTFPDFPVFLVGPTGASLSELVCLDGNHRIVAACMGGVDTMRLPVWIGTSPSIEQWMFYRDSPKLRLTTLQYDL